MIIIRLKGTYRKVLANMAWAFYVLVKEYIDQAFCDTVWIKHSRKCVSGEGL